MSQSHMEYSSLTEETIAAYKELQDLTKVREKLFTRIKSFQARKEDFDAWRKVSRAAAEADEEADNAQKVYAKNLGALMHDLESLFQKNLIDIRIKLSRSE